MVEHEDEHGPEDPCDDCCFHEMGDMLTPNELRRAQLNIPEHRELRDQYLAEYDEWGIEPDQDPSLFVIDMPPGWTVGEALDAVSTAWQIRRARPGDFDR